MSYGNTYGGPKRALVIEPHWIGWRGVITRHPSITDLQNGLYSWAFTREGLINRLKRVDRRQQRRIKREKELMRRENEKFNKREIISLEEE